MRIMRVDACDYVPLRSRGLRLILSDYVSELLNTQGRPPPPLGAHFRINAQHQVVLASPLGLVAPEKAGFRPTSCSGNRLARVVAAFSPPRHNGGSRSGMTRGSARALLTTNVDVPRPCPGVCILM